MRRALPRPQVLFTVGILCVVGSSCGGSTPDPSYVPRAEGTLTFTKDIAPIVYENCSSCHRPDGGAPFDLLTYEDVRTRSRQITSVTEDRYMPPWLPTVERGHFVGERVLSDDEIGMIAQWAQEGGQEGSPEDLPPAPTWPEGWTLGTPDLVLELPTAYELPAGGADVYRNFVLDVPLEQAVRVRAFEFDPGNAQVVHHALVRLDPTSRSRELDEESPEPGFGDLSNMEMPETVVNSGDGGFFHGWNPGMAPFRGYDDMSWPLDSTHDIVLQLHMRPSGKVEQVQPSVALYFAEKPPTRFPLVIGMRAANLDIPAGRKNYSFEKSYTLPVDVDVLAISLHAHYIGKELQGYADLPDGTRQWLIHVRDWDFNWQEEYRYQEPVFLPKGTRITQRFSYDNSSSNPRNPTIPPIRVRDGASSLDEMGEMWMQVLPRRAVDRAVLKQDHLRSYWGNETAELGQEYELFARELERNALRALEKNPADWLALLDMAKCRGSQNRFEEAIDYAQQALTVAPDEAETHCMLGHLLVGRDDERAIEHLSGAISLRPDLAKAHLLLGTAWKRRGLPDKAEQAFAAAHDHGPDDPMPLFQLGILAAEQGKTQRAIKMFQESLVVEPRFKPASDALVKIRGTGGQGRRNPRR